MDSSRNDASGTGSPQAPDATNKVRAHGSPASGMALVFTAAIMWSTSGIFIKVLTVNGFALMGIRSALAFLALLPWIRWRSVRVDANLVLLTCAFAATQLLFIFATRLTTAANAIALQATAPVWVFALGCLFGRRIQMPLLLPMGLIAGGISVMLSEPTTGTSMEGNLMGAVTGFTFALTQIASKRLNQPAIGAIALANLGSSFIALALRPGAFDLGVIGGWEWGILFYLGAFQISLPFVMFTVGVQRISVAQGSVLTLIEPICNPIWVYLVIAEIPSTQGFAGYGLILGGVFVDLWLRLYLPSLRHSPESTSG